MFLGVWATGGAQAAQVTATTPTGMLHPGVPATVWVAVVEDNGEEPVRAPIVTVEEGLLQYGDPAPWRGVFTYLVTPPDAEVLRLQVRVGETVHWANLPITPVPRSQIVLPRITASTAAEQVRFVVTGDDLPPPEALDVVVGEGSVSSVQRVGRGLEVTLAPGESPYPRVIPVGVRDRRADTSPAWGVIRLHARVPIPLQTEPGVTATFMVGSRVYGPFQADEQGGLLATVTQYPGEMQATVVLVDSVGNENRSTWPLSAFGAPSMAMMVSGSQLPGQPPPEVFVFAVHGDGHSWAGRAPHCRTPAMGELGLVPLGEGSWLVPMSTRRGAGLQDLRLACKLNSTVSRTVRVPVASAVPDRLQLRVWPQQLSTDFPEAEVQVQLTDLGGDRMNVDGVQVLAERGEVVLESSRGLVARGIYNGHAAIEAGSDVLHARYDAMPGEGPVGALRVGWEPTSESDEMRIHGRALDLSGRPLAGIELSLSAGSGAVRATTGADGWASASVPSPESSGALIVSAMTPRRKAQGLALPGQPGVGGPGTPDLRAEQAISLAPGRTDRVVVVLEPSTLFVARRALAWIKVEVHDQAGGLVTDEPITLEVDEGQVGPLELQPDGTFLAQYTPAPGGAARQVQVLARTKAGATGSAPLRLDPKPVDLAFGITFGGVTNFGAVASPLGGLHLDIRTKLAGGTGMLRLGASTYYNNAKVPLAPNDPESTAGAAVSRLTLVPTEIGLLFRREGRGRAVWVGGVGSLTMFRQEARFGGTQVATGYGVLPGIGAIGGVGVRAGVGVELVAEGSWLQTAPPRGDLRYRGTVGGLSLAGGFRLVY